MTPMTTVPRVLLFRRCCTPHTRPAVGAMSYHIITGRCRLCGQAATAADRTVRLKEQLRVSPRERAKHGTRRRTIGDPAVCATQRKMSCFGFRSP